jgi:hypothetical protein
MQFQGGRTVASENGKEEDARNLNEIEMFAVNCKSMHFIWYTMAFHQNLSASSSLLIENAPLIGRQIERGNRLSRYNSPFHDNSKGDMIEKLAVKECGNNVH